jgi:hypothetical protein
MPDLAITSRYMRRMTIFERSFISELEELYSRMRRSLLDELSDRRVSWTVVRAVLERELLALERNAVTLGRGRAPELAALTGEYGDALAAALRKAGVNVPDVSSTTYTERVSLAAESLGNPAWPLAVRARFLADLARLAMGGEFDEDDLVPLLGRGMETGRASSWRAALNTLTLGAVQSAWSAAAGGIELLFKASETSGEKQLGRQAVAAIDERTTECCLMVHGQVVKMGQPFHLTGEPKFADYVDTTPFHWNCRSAVSLYHPAMEAIGVPTEKMREAARAELRARDETKQRVEIHPSHATSRRQA